MACGENEIEVVQFLQKLKVILQKEPFFVICDFGAALISGIRKVFPNSSIGHDYFHTAKLLNDGLLKEMKRLKKIEFSHPIQEYHKARTSSQDATISKICPSLHFKNPFLEDAWIFYCQLHKLVFSKTLTHFLTAWNELKRNQSSSKWENGLQIMLEVEKTLPQCGFTQKNFIKYWKDTCNVWRRVVRQNRIELEKKQEGYSKASYRVLMNPINMTTKDHQKLRESLKKFPFLRNIRSGVREFHNQFKTNNDNWRNLNFLQKLVQKHSHHALKSAVSTIIEAESRIFAYRDILSRNPKLQKGKSIRSNHEELNKKIGLVARNQYGLRSTSGACTRIGGILNCAMITSEALWKKELDDL